MSQYYRQSGILPPVSCEIRVFFFLLFHVDAALFSRQLQLQDFSFFVWSSTKGFGLLARRSHSSAACMYRQVRRMTGALVGQKMQFGEISEKVGGNERQGEGRSGGGGQCLEGIQRNLIDKVDDLRANGCFNRRKKSCLLKQKPPLNPWLCGGAVRLIHFNQSYLWAHSACRIITTLRVLDWLRIQPIWRQGQSHRDAGAPICSHLILYLSLKVESHYASSTIQNSGLLCPFRARHSDRHWDKDRQPWLWPTSTTLPAWAVASRCTS